MKPSTLVAIPALNESVRFEKVARSLARVQNTGEEQPRFDVLIVDDGSTDSTASIAMRFGWEVEKHEKTQGYGASLATAFCYARYIGYRHMITMDADGQHSPNVIPDFLRVREFADIISGSRYLPNSIRVNEPPAPHVNRFLTYTVNNVFGLGLTDVACGMKCINVRVTCDWEFTDKGYLFPIEFWSKCSLSRCSIHEIPVPMIYLDRTRNHEQKFGSIEMLIDQAVFAILKAACQLDVIYSKNYGSVLEPSSASISKLESILDTLTTLVCTGFEYGVPTIRAVENLRLLSSRLRGAVK